MAPLEHALCQATTTGHIPGVSLAELRAGDIGPAHFLGRRSTHDPAPVDAHTVFEAASLTKPPVAFIALQLVDEGVVDLDTPLHELCGEYVPDDDRALHITAGHVLIHPSGLSNIVSEASPLKTHFAPGGDGPGVVVPADHRAGLHPPRAGGAARRGWPTRGTACGLRMRCCR